MIQYESGKWISKSSVIEIYIFDSRVKFNTALDLTSTVAVEFEESFLMSFGIDSNKVQGIKKRQENSNVK